MPSLFAADAPHMPSLGWQPLSQPRPFHSAVFSPVASLQSYMTRLDSDRMKMAALNPWLPHCALHYLERAVSESRLWKMNEVEVWNQLGNLLHKASPEMDSFVRDP